MMSPHEIMTQESGTRYLTWKLRVLGLLQVEYAIEAIKVRSLHCYGNSLPDKKTTANQSANEIRKVTFAAIKYELCVTIFLYFSHCGPC